MNFKALQDEVSRSALRNKAGTEFTEAIKTVINRAYFRLCYEALWRPLRRKTEFKTVESYAVGSGAVNIMYASDTANITGASMYDDDVQIDRWIKISGDSRYFRLDKIRTNGAQITLNHTYNGTSTLTGTYEILPQEIYNLPEKEKKEREEIKVSDPQLERAHDVLVARKIFMNNAEKQQQKEQEQKQE